MWGLLLPEHIWHCLNLPVVFPLFFALGEQLSSEVLSLLPPGVVPGKEHSTPWVPLQSCGLCQDPFLPQLLH